MTFLNYRNVPVFYSNYRKFFVFQAAFNSRYAAVVQASRASLHMLFIVILGTLICVVDSGTWNFSTEILLGMFLPQFLCSNILISFVEPAQLITTVNVLVIDGR